MAQGSKRLHGSAGRSVRGRDGLFALGIFALAGCAGSSNGEACLTDLDCQASFVCVADPGLPRARCMRPCAAGVRLCDDGAVCLELAGGRACYPGGAIGFGEACVRSLDCEAGTVCPLSTGRCMQACDGTLPVCRDTELCVPGEDVGPFCGR
jgi:hypothetical protein